MMFSYTLFFKTNNFDKYMRFYCSFYTIAFQIETDTMLELP